MTLARSRKTTNRLRAIETKTILMAAEAVVPVARQLIAFGRLKRSAAGCCGVHDLLVARQLIAFGRLKPFIGPANQVATTMSQDN